MASAHIPPAVAGPPWFIYEHPPGSQTQLVSSSTSSFSDGPADGRSHVATSPAAINRRNSVRFVGRGGAGANYRNAGEQDEGQNVLTTLIPSSVWKRKNSQSSASASGSASNSQPSVRKSESIDSGERPAFSSVNVQADASQFRDGSLAKQVVSSHSAPSTSSASFISSQPSFSASSASQYSQPSSLAVGTGRPRPGHTHIQTQTDPNLLSHHQSIPNGTPGDPPKVIRMPGRGGAGSKPRVIKPTDPNATHGGLIRVRWRGKRGSRNKPIKSNPHEFPHVYPHQPQKLAPRHQRSNSLASATSLGSSMYNPDLYFPGRMDTGSMPSSMHSSTFSGLPPNLSRAALKRLSSVPSLAESTTSDQSSIHFAPASPLPPGHYPSTGVGSSQPSNPQTGVPGRQGSYIRPTVSPVPSHQGSTASSFSELRFAPGRGRSRSHSPGPHRVLGYGYGEPQDDFGFGTVFEQEYSGGDYAEDDDYLDDEEEYEDEQSRHMALAAAETARKFYGRQLELAAQSHSQQQPTATRKSPPAAISPMERSSLNSYTSTHPTSLASSFESASDHELGPSSLQQFYSAQSGPRQISGSMRDGGGPSTRANTHLSPISLTPIPIEQNAESTQPMSPNASMTPTEYSAGSTSVSNMSGSAAPSSRPAPTISTNLTTPTTGGSAAPREPPTMPQTGSRWVRNQSKLARTLQASTHGGPGVFGGIKAPSLVSGGPRTGSNGAFGKGPPNMGMKAPSIPGMNGPSVTVKDRSLGFAEAGQPKRPPPLRLGVEFQDGQSEDREHAEVGKGDIGQITSSSHDLTPQGDGVQLGAATPKQDFSRLASGQESSREEREDARSDDDDDGSSGEQGFKLDDDEEKNKEEEEDGRMPRKECASDSSSSTPQSSLPPQTDHMPVNTPTPSKAVQAFVVGSPTFGTHHLETEDKSSIPPPMTSLSPPPPPSAPPPERDSSMIANSALQPPPPVPTRRRPLPRAPVAPPTPPTLSAVPAPTQAPVEPPSRNRTRHPSSSSSSYMPNNYLSASTTHTTSPVRATFSIREEAGDDDGYSQTSRQGDTWSGTWNRNSMADVITSLRTLKSSS